MRPKECLARLSQAVEAWRPDSGFADYREAQRQAKTRMRKLLWRDRQFRWETVSDSAEERGYRFFLIDVSEEVTVHASLAGWDSDPPPICREIPEVLLLWQQVLIDNLNFVGYTGARVEIRRETNTAASWWITIFFPIRSRELEVF